MKLTKFGALALTVLCSASVGAQQRIKPFPEFSKARALTTGPHDHFFANYFAINPWSPDNRYALVLETDLKDKLPDGTPCTLGLVDTEDNNKFIPSPPRGAGTFRRRRWPTGCRGRRTRSSSTTSATGSSAPS